MISSGAAALLRSSISRTASRSVASSILVSLASRSDVSPKSKCYYHSSSATTSSALSNGKFLNYSMMYHDSVAFLLSNQLGIPAFMASSAKTPTQVAEEFNLSVRAASALLVTLCRMDIVNVHTDNNESVDDIVYELTPSASEYRM